MSSPRPLAVTVNDVARLAGVSVATAARALGNYGSVSSRSRESVESAAAELGYRPNMVARSMITKTTHTVGVILSDIENSFFIRALRGITDRLAESGYDVLLANSDEDPDKEHRALQLMAARQVDGLIVVPTEASERAALAELIEGGAETCESLGVDSRLIGVAPCGELDCYVFGDPRLSAPAIHRLPAAESEQAAYLRGQALALVNEYRLVPCAVEAQLTSGKPAHIEGRLNLTNGHIFLDASHRQTRLQAGQGALRVSIAGTPVALAAECSGHTLTGPVLDVAVGSLVPHRDVLLARWQAG